MPEVFVNEIPTNVDPAPQTWGDLLARLDEQATRDGLLLTTARFDGVDVPAFRDPVMTVHRLTAVGRVDVETAAPAAFVRQCLMDAVPALEQAAAMATRLAHVYRGHDVSSGHEGLTTLAIELGGLAALVAMLDGPLRIDLTGIVVEGVTATEHVDALGAILHAVVAAQESEDWLTVADVLEYDLEPAIRRWIVLLTMVAKQVAA